MKTYQQFIIENADVKKHLKDALTTLSKNDKLAPHVYNNPNTPTHVKKAILKKYNMKPSYYMHLKTYDRFGVGHYKKVLSAPDVLRLLDKDPDIDHDTSLDAHAAIHSSDLGQTLEQHIADLRSGKGISAGYEEGVVGIHHTKKGATENMRKADSAFNDENESEWED